MTWFTHLRALLHNGLKLFVSHLKWAGNAAGIRKAPKFQPILQLDSSGHMFCLDGSYHSSWQVDSQFFCLSYLCLKNKPKLLFFPWLLFHDWFPWRNLLSQSLFVDFPSTLIPFGLGYPPIEPWKTTTGLLCSVSKEKTGKTLSISFCFFKYTISQKSCLNLLAHR